MHKAIGRKVSLYLRKTSSSNQIPSETPGLPNSSSSDTQSSSAPLPRNILAFRTITSMLSWIQQAQIFEDPNLKSADPANRKELKIVNALATIMVVDNEVVAVVAKHDVGAEALQAIVCAHLADDKKNLTHSQSPGIMGQLWQFLITQNPRRDDPSPSCSNRPLIVDPEIPAGLEPNNMEGLKEYISARW